ncbi:MAG: winged helix-turn-helix transcriptional regulator [Nanoarchaeota archaeon]|nr:winged helix-turn-helix transcriptional regulator [Nanoarchaeota archaeon]
MSISAQKTILTLLVLLFCIQAVSAAKISGNVYDISLEKAIDVIIEIDTSPKQKMISKEGSYSFNVPLGNYTITAGMYIDNLLEAYATEDIQIIEEGEYNVDLIIFPYIGDDENLIQEGNISLPETLFEEIDAVEEKEGIDKQIIITAILLIIALVAIMTLWKHAKKPKKRKQRPVSFISITKELQDIVEVIRKNGGRTTQKEIRKQIPLSEAKISLMIAELEDKGIVKKIKKGRGNIIILRGMK